MNTKEWDHLPDPLDRRAPKGQRCTVILDRAFEHIVRKHVSDHHEPWCDLLPADVISKVCALWHQRQLDRIDAATFNTFAASLESELRRSLEQPRVLLYQSSYEDSEGRWQQVWAAVLPCGAELVVRESGRQRNFVSTCFFRERVRSLPLTVRWQRLCELLREWYTVSGQGGQREPAQELKIRHDPEEAADELRRDFRFVTPPQWGMGPSGTDDLPDWHRATAPKAQGPKLNSRRRTEPGGNP